MLILLLLSLLLSAVSIGYFWGPDDTTSQSLTSREKRALSVSVGLGVGVPLIAQSYQAPLLIFFGGIVSGLLSSAVAGRRPFLHGYLTNALLLEWWFLLSFLNRSPSTHAWSVLLLISVAALTIFSLLLGLSSTVLYPVWEQRRKRDAETQPAVGCTVEVPRVAISLIAQGMVLASNPLTALTVENESTRVLTRQ